MKTTSWTLKRLDTETRSLHAESDERWLSLLHPTVTLLEYATQLERAYGFVAPYDAGLAYTPKLALRPKSRTTLLVRDLLSLGRSPLQVAKLPMCLDIDPACPIEALGWIYVVERSALVHAGLLRYLRQHLPIANACAYLAADESPFGPRWEELGRAFDQANAFDKIIAGAREAFAVQRGWFADATDLDAEVSYG